MAAWERKHVYRENYENVRLKVNKAESTAKVEIVIS